jgi:putative peptide zinc metalloprotease protein
MSLQQPFSAALTSTADRPVRLRMRRDLIACRQYFQGLPYRVVKDPLSLRFYRFEEEEYAVLEMLDGNTSPAAIQDEFQRRFAPQRLSLSELQRLFAKLFRASLVVSAGSGQGQRLTERAREQAWNERKAAWTNLLCIRLPGVNPDRFLELLNRVCGWLFSLPAIVLGLLVILAAAITVALHFETFLDNLPAFYRFFAVENLISLMVILAATKVLHELGHGLVCKRFGAQCHEVGVMFLVLMPCLYCNVSDSWMLPSKWQRAAIGVAGIYVELLLAAVCTFLWWFSEPGALHYFALNVMFVCSVNTILFNANPLLRYDGYFVLSDLAEIPNLQQKAFALVYRGVQRIFLGLRNPPDSFLPQRHRLLFAAYAVAAVIYRWLVLASILWLLYKMFEPYDLKIIGQCIAGFAALMLVVQPLSRLITFLRVPGRFREVKKLRLAFVSCLVGGLIFAGMLMPVPFFIPCDFELRPDELTTVYVEVAGTLEESCVRDGSVVRKGQEIIRLGNVEMLQKLAHLKGERARQATELESLRTRAHQDETALRGVAQAEQACRAFDHQIRQWQQDIQRLIVRAPTDGTVVTIRRSAREQSSDRLPTWSGDPLAVSNRGTFLHAGTGLCQVANLSRLQAVLVVDEDVVPYLQVGQPVKLFPAQSRGMSVRGTVQQISRLESSESRAMMFRPAASDESAGLSAGQRTQMVRRNQMHASYEAIVRMDQHHAMLWSGGGGRAKIFAGYRCLGKRLADYLRRTFHFEA